MDGPTEVDFVIDTGFAGDLSLPASLAFRLHGSRLRNVLRRMADGRLVECPAFKLNVRWNESDRVVDVIVLAGPPLLGTDFFEGCIMHTEMWQGGSVELELPE